MTNHSVIQTYYLCLIPCGPHICSSLWNQIFAYQTMIANNATFSLKKFNDSKKINLLEVFLLRTWTPYFECAKGPFLLMACMQFLEFFSRTQKPFALQNCTKLHNKCLHKNLLKMSELSFFLWTFNNIISTAYLRISKDLAFRTISCGKLGST